MLRRHRLGLLQRILRGGRNTAVARAAIFGNFFWESGSRATPRLQMFKNDVSFLLQRNAHLLPSIEMTDQQQLAFLASATKKILGRVRTVALGYGVQ